MPFMLSPTEDLGLRHVLESGLEIIRNKDACETRRAEIIDDLIEIFSQAQHASQVLQGQNLLAGIGQRTAFDKFSLFYTYLPELRDDLPRRLPKAIKDFQSLKDGYPESKTNETADLIEAFLAAMEQDMALSRPVVPSRFNSFDQE